MNPSTLLIVIVIAIALSVFLSNKLKVNAGLVAFGLSLIICIFGMGLNYKKVNEFFPLNTVLTIISITAFFGFANANGAPQKLAKLILWKFRRFPKLVPFAFLILGFVMSLTGANPFAITATLMPLAFNMMVEAGIDVQLGSWMVALGSMSAGNVPWGNTAAIQRGAIQGTEYEPYAEQIVNHAFFTFLIWAIVLAILIYIFFKGYKIGNTEFKITKPEPFDTKQKVVLILIVVFVLLMFVPAVGSSITGSKALRALSSKLNITYVAFFFAAVCGCLKLADCKQVINREIPWNTIIMLSGIAVLVNAAADGGAVDAVGSWVGANIPKFLVIPVVAFLTGFLSIFVSSANVCMPTMFALVPSIAAASGVNFFALYLAIAVGAMCTSCSPFSGGGSVTLSLCPTEELRVKMFPRLLMQAGTQLVYTFILGLIGFFALMAI